MLADDSTISDTKETPRLPEQGKMVSFDVSHGGESISDTYREPVDLENMLYKGDIPSKLNVSPSLAENVLEHSIPSDTSPISPTSAVSEISSISHTPSMSIPDTSTAAELRRKENASPIERGPAPRVESIKEALARERALLKSEEIIQKTEPGNPLFAASVMASQEKTPEEYKEDEKREKEALERGQALADEAGEKRDMKSLRTFQSDLAEAMRGNKQSMVQGILSEHGKELEKEEKLVQVKKKNAVFTYAGVFFGILGLVVLAFGGGYVYSLLGTFSGTGGHGDVEVPGFFSVEEKRELDVGGLGEYTVRTYAGELVLSTDMLIDSFAQLYPVEWTEDTATKEKIVKVLSTSEFLSRADMSVPPRLVRTLDEIFMFGVHVWNGNQGFLVFRIATGVFDDAFSSMLEWEDDMAGYVLPLFGVTPDAYTLNAKWSDTVIKNRDVRVLKNELGDIVLLYTFYDRKTLIISTSPDTMDEIIGRILQAKRK